MSETLPKDPVMLLSFINLIDELRNNEMLIEEEGDFQLEDV